jgi:hypothetical protein
VGGGLRERRARPPGPGEAARESRFDDNYAFFRSQIRVDEAAHLWRGLTKLEHVSITLGPAANAQQTFESLNSTGEPLRDHELIHNYVLMGSRTPSRARSRRVLGADRARHRRADRRFWRHYLIMLTGRGDGRR